METPRNPNPPKSISGYIPGSLIVPSRGKLKSTHSVSSAQEAFIYLYFYGSVDEWKMTTCDC